MKSEEALNWCEQFTNNIIQVNVDTSKRTLALQAIKTIKSALEKQIPKNPIHIHEEYEKHQWRKNDNGEVDEWAFSSGYCNGVVCERCHDVECVICNPDYDNKPCIIDKYLCPLCHLELLPNEHHCKCGQTLDWSKEE